ncbi:hypothetical protein LCGC14_2166710 [marine sediment metagenome]|uniref:Uncharacterized protein n=1 Tax=marine sediment metagenome TaxID=412755 RepID=A0A0F9DR58_9ZZZZ
MEDEETQTNESNDTENVSVSDNVQKKIKEQELGED